MVNTKYGPVSTDHVLFIAAGAFHLSKPGDLIPELQGRFPLRVELEPLTVEDFRSILREPENNLPRQYSALLGTDLPGVGTIYTGQTLKFTRPVHFGEEITASVTVKELNTEQNRAVFECLAVNPQGEPVIIGEATVMPPKAS